MHDCRFKRRVSIYKRSAYSLIGKRPLWMLNLKNIARETNTLITNLKKKHTQRKEGKKNTQSPHNLHAIGRKLHDFRVERRVSIYKRPAHLGDRYLWVVKLKNMARKTNIQNINSKPYAAPPLTSCTTFSCFSIQAVPPFPVSVSKLYRSFPFQYPSCTSFFRVSF